MLLLLLSVACPGPCADAVCLGDAAVHDWPTDSKGVTARVVALPDEMTRATVVSRLAEAYPGQTASLCTALPRGVSQDRCQRLNNRPHLSFDPAAPPPPPVVAPVSGGAPAAMGATATGVFGPKEHSLPDAYIPVAPATVDAALCAGVPDRPACLDAEAVKTVVNGDAAMASAICGEHPEARWADECRFHAAEEGVRIRHGRAYAAAAAMCGVATSFTQECWVHILTWLPKTVPPPEAGGRAIEDAVALAERVHAAWSSSGEDVAALHVDRFWALYFTHAYQQTRAPDGTPLAAYPEAAWPHVRAAAAMRMRELGQLRGTLSEQVAQLDAALVRRANPGPGGHGVQPVFVYVKDFGPPPDDGPTVFFLNSARRPVSMDPAADALYCVVVTAAHADPPDTAALAEAAAHADPRIAAEARRLTASLGPVP